jgi:hypothetical protein
MSDKSHTSDDAAIPTLDGIDVSHLEEHESSMIAITQALQILDMVNEESLNINTIKVPLGKKNFDEDVLVIDLVVDVTTNKKKIHSIRREVETYRHEINPIAYNPFWGLKK